MMEQSVAKLVYCESTNATAIQKVQNHFQFSKSSFKMNTFTESQYQVSMATLGSMYMSSRGWQGWEAAVPKRQGQERNDLSGEGAMQKKVLKVARKSENRVWETGDSSLPVCLPHIDRDKVTNSYCSIRFV